MKHAPLYVCAKIAFVGSPSTESWWLSYCISITSCPTFIILENTLKCGHGDFDNRNAGCLRNTILENLIVALLVQMFLASDGAWWSITMLTAAWSHTEPSETVSVMHTARLSLALSSPSSKHTTLLRGSHFQNQWHLAEAGNNSNHPGNLKQYSSGVGVRFSLSHISFTDL
jgi:hypothetical protein